MEDQTTEVIHNPDMEGRPSQTLRHSRAGSDLENLPGNPQGWQIVNIEK